MGKAFDDYLKKEKEKEEKEAVKAAETGNRKFYSNLVKKSEPVQEAPIQTAPVSTLTPDERRQRTLNIISQSGAALKGMRSARGIDTSGITRVKQEIEDLTKSGASGQLVKAKQNEFNRYKTEQYDANRQRQKSQLLNKAEKDPDFAAMVEKGKNIYDTVNKEKDRKKFSVSFSPENMSHVGAGDMEDWASRNYKFNNFTDEERDTYLYILGKEGWTAADKYEELISRDVNARTAAKETEFLTDWARKNKPAAVALNTASSFLGGAALADTIKQGIRNAGRSDTEFIPADNNSGAFLAPRIQAAMTEGITGDIKSPAGKFMAQTGLSTANFLANAAVGGGAVSLGLMGANAGGSGAYEAIERGATPGQAAMLGLVNAAAEIAFERIPVGEFGKLASGDVKKTFAKAMIDMAKEEGMEELATEYVNLLGDNIIMGDNSEMQAYIKELMAQGMSEDEAKKAALSEFAVKRPAMAFLGGAVSGAGIGAAGSGIGRVNMMMDPAMQEIVKTVQESTGMSKAKAWSAVFKAVESGNAENIPENAENIPENAENNTANAENVPQEFEAFNETEQEAGGQDWREELISAVMENSGMDRANAERAVSEASGDIVPTTEQNEPERIWERAAREQAAYDEEWERAHQPTAEEQARDYEARIRRTQEAVNEIEAQEAAKQEQAVRQAVKQTAVNNFNQAFKKIADTKINPGADTRFNEAFEIWVENEIEQKGIPEAFKNNPEQYARYLFWNIEQDAKQNYKMSKGSTVYGKMSNALRQTLSRYISGAADTGVNAENAPAKDRISARRYLAENPEGAREFFDTNYGGQTDEIWGTDILKDRDEGNRREKLGQDFEIAKRQLQRKEDEIRKAKKRYGENYFTKTEKSNSDALVNAVLSTAGVEDAGIRNNIVNNVVNQLKRNEPNVQFPNGARVPVSPLSDRGTLAEMLPFIVEHDFLAGEYQGTSGDLQIKAQELAKEAVSKLDASGEDKRAPLFYYIEAAVRNWEDVFKKNPAIAKWFNENYTNQQGKNNQKMVQMENEVFDTVRDLDIDTGKKKTYALSFSDKAGNAYIGDYNESAILQIYGEGLIDDQKLNSLKDKKGNSIDADKIRHAKDVISAEYKKLLKSINNVLVEYGYTPSLEITDYFPHYNEQSISAWENFMSMLGFNTDIQDLPTEIAGRTGSWKPGKQWFGNILERQGQRTKFDAIDGFQKYVRVAGNIIYHTGDVQKLRALGNAIRGNYGTSLYQSQMRQLNESRIRGSITPEEYYNETNKLNEDNEGRLTKFNNLVKWIDESANLQAGKQSFLDRAVENLFSRKSLGWAQNITQRISRNMVNGNISSSLTNFIPIAQDDTGAKYKLQGLKDTIKTGLKRDGFVDNSAFLTNRYGVEPLVTTGLDNFAKKAGFLMETIDHITAEGLVRARYYQNLDAGMDEQSAMDEADDHVARVMADRTRGQAPTIFDVKNPLVKSLTMFQTEVKNQYSWMFKDLPRQNRDKALGVLTAGLFKLILASFIYNEATEKITGRRAATDFADIVWETLNDFKGRERANLFDVAFAGEDLYRPKELNGSEKRKRLATRILDQVPGNAIFGGRIPLKEAFPDLSVINENLDSAGTSAKAKGKIWKEALKPLALIAAPTGGIQAKKIYEGLSEAIQGGSYDYDKDNNKKLRYPVEQTPETFIKNAIFGKTASQGYKDWKRNGMKNLNVRQTEAYPYIVKAGIDYDTYMKFVYEISGKNTKWETARTIYNMDGLTNAQKNILWERAVRKDYAEKGNQPDFTMSKKEFYDTWHGKGDDEE